MKTIRFALLLGVPLAALGAELKPAPRPENYAPAAYLRDRVELRPILDEPLRHTYVMRGPDGAFYLTGTVASTQKSEARGQRSEAADFQNNDGIWLWRSTDLKTWQPLGQVWSIERQGAGWQKEKNLNPEDPAGPLVRGVTAPEIHFLKGTWWLCYSMNGHGTGLLKSASGKPEGPYEDAGRMTAGGANASMFEDFDPPSPGGLGLRREATTAQAGAAGAAVYWVWGPGRIARMKDDLSGLAEAPRQLTFEARYPLTGRMPKLHFPESVSLLKTDAGRRRYFLIVESGSCRLGGYTRDSHIFESDSLFGPFGTEGDLKNSDLLLEHGAQSTVFEDGAGRWYATFYGADNKAVWRDRPAIVSMDYDRGGGRPVRGRGRREFTERGPWATMPPLIEDVAVNDEQMLNAPDGGYYFTGSMFGDAFRKHGLSVWKSKTLEPRSVQPENWQEFTPVTVADIPFLAALAAKDPTVFDFTPRRPKLGTWWNAEIHYLKGNFWIVGGPSINDKATQEAMDQAGLKGRPLWRSKTGRAEGPYEIHAWLSYSCPSFFEDDDGKVYFLEGVSQMALMKDDLSGVDEAATAAIGNARGIKSYGYWNRLATTENLVMDYDIGNCMVKIGGKYVFFSCNCIGGYDYQYFVADDIWGPYSRPRVAMPHGGHSFVMKDKEGAWRCLQWASMGMVPFLHELHVEDTGDDVIIMPKWEFEHRKAAAGRR
jgi:GH43 family beta-xylosidase